MTSITVNIPKLLEPAFLNLSSSTVVDGNDFLIYYNSGTGYTSKATINDIFGALSGGTGTANAYSYISDDNKIASASGADTFKLISANNLLEIVVSELPDDRATFTINQDNFVFTLSQITGLTVTETELNYLSGVTSNIQDQIDSITNGLTINYIPIFNGTGFSDSRFVQSGETTALFALSALPDDNILHIQGQYGRTFVTNRGAQTWYMADSLNVYQGKISYSTPAGNPGILFLNNVGTKRSDFRQYDQTNGGLYFGVDVVGGATTKYMVFKNASVGQLGINKDPSYPLDVVGHIYSSENVYGRQLSLLNNSPTTTSNSVSAAGGHVQIRGDNGVFLARGSTRMITANNTGVAIGTSSTPSYPLDITTGGVRIQGQSSAPASGASGVLYTNSTDSRFYFHDGTTWRKLLFDSDDLTQYSLSDGTRWSSGQTADRVAISDSNGYLVAGDITTTELSYLSGATSNIQEQINNISVDMNSNPNNQEVSGIKTTFVAYDSQNFGDAVFINSSGQTQIGNAEVIATSGVIAICTETVSSGNTATYLLQGFLKDSGWAWNIGEFIYLATGGTTTNTLTQTPANNVDNVVQVLGVATASDKFYFNPQLVQIEIQL